MIERPDPLKKLLIGIFLSLLFHLDTWTNRSIIRNI
jgi:hypothetical protein